MFSKEPEKPSPESLQSNEASTPPTPLWPAYSSAAVRMAPSSVWSAVGSTERSCQESTKLCRMKLGVLRAVCRVRVMDTSTKEPVSVLGA